MREKPEKNGNRGGAAEQTVRGEDHNGKKDDKVKSRLSVGEIAYAVGEECCGLLQQTAEKAIGE